MQSSGYLTRICPRWLRTTSVRSGKGSGEWMFRLNASSDSVSCGSSAWTLCALTRRPCGRLMKHSRMLETTNAVGKEVVTPHLPSLTAEERFAVEQNLSDLQFYYSGNKMNHVERLSRAVRTGQETRPT